MVAIEVQPAVRSRLGDADGSCAGHRHREAVGRHHAPMSPAWRQLAVQGVDSRSSPPAACCARHGDGKGTLTVALAGKTATVPVEVTGTESRLQARFHPRRQPGPREGGLQRRHLPRREGRQERLQALAARLRSDLRRPRVRGRTLAAAASNVASPDDSLMLLKATGAVPHEGGQRHRARRAVLRDHRAWIADGAKLERSHAARDAASRSSRRIPSCSRSARGSRCACVATYADGEIARRDGRGVRRKRQHRGRRGRQAGPRSPPLRRGEAPVLARLRGRLRRDDAHRDGRPHRLRLGRAAETWNKIDELVAAKWQRMKILPSDLCSDAEFLRRVYLDLTGLPPTAGGGARLPRRHRATRAQARRS